MRTFGTLLVVVGLTCAGLAWAESNKSSAQRADLAENSVPAGAASHAGPEAKDSLIVHEWGTFTSISGADGVRLEFRPLVDNDLPDFVVNRAWQAGRAPSPFLKWSIQSFQRMETPITYFYTDRERDVEVKVGFPQGLLTEFYPPVESMTPEFRFDKRAAIGNSELNWGRVTLIPPERFLPVLRDPDTARAAQQRILEKIAPDSDSHPHYKHARHADSAIVHVRRPFVPDRPYTPAGDFFEKYLFYRGVGNFALPLTAVAHGAGRIEVSNSGTDSIRSLFLVTKRDNQLFVRTHAELVANGRVTMAEGDTPKSMHDLGQLVVAALVAEGLYQKEAEAMVATWSDSWFAEEGTRLFYMLPARITDELLPLKITPRPNEIVRVMVGRMEIISPEEEARLEQIVEASAQARRDAQTQREAGSGTTDGGSTKPAFPEAFTKMGRLAEPALARVRGFSKNEVIRNEAATLLHELRAFQMAEAAEAAEATR